MGPHMSCSYSGIAIRQGCSAGKDSEMIICVMEPILGRNELFDFINIIDTTGKIKFTMSVTNESVLEFFI